MPQVIVNNEKWKEAIEDLEISRELAKQVLALGCLGSLAGGRELKARPRGHLTGEQGRCVDDR